jgi:hypothetical protein
MAFLMDENRRTSPISSAQVNAVIGPIAFHAERCCQEDRLLAIRAAAFTSIFRTAKGSALSAAFCCLAI